MNIYFKSYLLQTFESSNQLIIVISEGPRDIEAAE